MQGAGRRKFNGGVRLVAASILVNILHILILITIELLNEIGITV